MSNLSLQHADIASLIIILITNKFGEPDRSGILQIAKLHLTVIMCRLFLLCQRTDSIQYIIIIITDIYIVRRMKCQT